MNHARAGGAGSAGHAARTFDIDRPQEIEARPSDPHHRRGMDDPLDARHGPLYRVGIAHVPQGHVDAQARQRPRVGFGTASTRTPSDRESSNRTTLLPKSPVAPVTSVSFDMDPSVLRSLTAATAAAAALPSSSPRVPPDRQRVHVRTSASNRPGGELPDRGRPPCRPSAKPDR